MGTQPGLRRTPLHERQRRAGAKLVDFAGWEMPVQYTGLIEEHRAVRAAAGLFDVSHMGELRVSGEQAEAFLQRMTPNDVSKLAPGQIQYSGLLTDRGTYLDDLLVYRLDEQGFLLVVNAANTVKNSAWLESHLPRGVNLQDHSERYALLALQGPKSRQILGELTRVDLSPLRYYRFVEGEVDGGAALISRTGYTGEDGFELYVAPTNAPRLWDRLLEVGRPLGLVAAGLGARDTLRLEAGMALYGHEIDETTTPWEAGLDWVVKLEKGDFVGRSALLAQQETGARRCLVGFEVTGRGIARKDHEVVAGGEPVGRVTSGSWSPTFEKAIGMAYVPVRLAEVGLELTIDVRGRPLAAVVVELPFYRRSK